MTRLLLLLVAIVWLPLKYFPVEKAKKIIETGSNTTFDFSKALPDCHLVAFNH